MNRILTVYGLATLLALSAAPARAQERHFVMVFGAQTTPPDPRHSHSFGIFVREVCGPLGKKLEPVGISWLACTGVVRLYAVHPEDGCNWGIHETLDWCYKNDMRVSVWGPYQCEPEVFCRAVKQKQLLESGLVRYKAVDSGRDSAKVSNCIHALSSVVTGYRLRVASPGWGETASYAITLRYEPYFINPEQKHLWLLPALGLGQYPIIFRDLEAPRSGALRSLFRSALHHSEKVPPAQVLGEAPVVPGPVPPP